MEIECLNCGENNKQFEVICDETNNTKEDVENRVLKADIFIRSYPAALYCKKCGELLI